MAKAFAASMRALLRRIDAPCIVASHATRPTIEWDGPCVDVDAVSPTEAALEPACAADPDALFCLQHSSGTTGLKKGVCLSHRAVLAQADSYAAAIGLASGDRIASWLPLYHDMGLMTGFLMPAIRGIPVISLDALEWSARPTILLDAVEQFRATLCWLPNFAFHHIARLAPEDRRWDLSSLRMVVNCSEPCRAPAFAAFTPRFVPRHVLQVSYALAECVFAATQTTPGEPVRASPLPAFAEYLSSGKPLDGVEICVRDAGGAVVPDGQPGEIHLRGAFLFDGYFREPDRSAACLRDGWYATGDLGFVEGGALFVVGRADDVLNINGRKILAHEMEEALAGLPGLAPGRILVFAEHDRESGATRLGVAAERETAFGRPDQAVIADLRRAVLAASALLPHRAILLERGFLVKSTSGKLARAASLEKLNASGAALF